jgi:hypothetical protein
MMCGCLGAIQVAALQPLRIELSKWAESLTNRMVEELLAKLFPDRDGVAEPGGSGRSGSTVEDGGASVLKRKAAVLSLVRGLHRLHALAAVRDALQQHLHTELRCEPQPQRHCGRDNMNRYIQTIVHLDRRGLPLGLGWCLGGV